MIILDTNVISEMLRQAPHPGILAWVEGKPGSTMFTTSVTRAEIMYGIAIMKAGRRRDFLVTTARDVFDIDFSARVLNFDRDASDAYAEISAARRTSGQPISVADAMIAAIAYSRGATLATRNVRDFVDCGVDVIDPWSGQ